MDIYKLLSIVSDPSRLKILYCLSLRHCNVSEIETIVGLSQANTSKHLKKMFECQILEKEQNGKEVKYYLSENYLATCFLFEPLMNVFKNQVDGIKINQKMEELYES